MGGDSEEATVQAPARQATRLQTLGLGDAQLAVVLGQPSGRRIALAKSTIVGRGEGADLSVEDDGASRRHARITFEDGTHVIEDLDSRNGTFVNGVAVRRTVLSLGDKIAIGSRTVLLFTRNDPVEAKLAQAQRLQMLGEISGGIAHDFNNVLSALLTGMDFLRDECNRTDAVDQCFADMDLAARRAMDLTSQLLAFGRGGEQEHTEVSLSNLVADSLRLIRGIVPASTIIASDIEDDIVVRGSGAQLLQVVVNLVVNASQAMPNGGTVTVRTHLGNMDPEKTGITGKAAIVEVADTGVGMDAETRLRALEPFFTTKARGDGTGLGLATVQRAVQRHAGHLHIESHPGQGTRMIVTLPCLDSGQISPPCQPAHHAPATSGTVVLLVDDEPVVRSATARALRSVGIEVLCAGDGLEAIEVFQRAVDRIQVVVLDLDLPRLRGEEVYDVITDIAPTVGVVVATGYSDANRCSRFSGPEVGFIAKPYRRQDLLDEIARALERSVA